MKKLFTIITALCFVLSFQKSIAQNFTVNDHRLEVYLVQNYPGCVTSAAGVTPVTFNSQCPAILNEDSLDFSQKGIADFNGLQYFTSLRYLNVYRNTVWGPDSLPLPASLKALIFVEINRGGHPFVLPSLPMGLEWLDCSENGLSDDIPTTLPPLPASLKYLNCANNNLTGVITLPPALDTLICLGNGRFIDQVITSYYTGITGFTSLPATLKYLDCFDNLLTSLPPLPASLTYLDCSNNIQTREIGTTDPNTGMPVYNYPYQGGISSLPPLPSGLKYLNCSGNFIDSLPVLPAALEELRCYGFRIYAPSGQVSQDTTFYNLRAIGGFPSGLKKINIWRNQLSSLPALPDSLWHLSAYENKLTSLPALPESISYINVERNNLGGLPDLPLTLTELLCDYNNNLTCIPLLPPQLQYLGIYSTRVRCIPNTVAGLTINIGVPLVCSVVNNINHCRAYPLMTGTVFYDINSNGVKDANENFRSNVEVSTSAGYNTYTDSLGHFEITGNLGANTLTVSAPPFFSAVPTSTSYNFNSYDTIVSQMYALQPIVSADSVATSIIPVTTARPGFSHYYQLNYENVGTTTVNSNISFNYDAARMSYVSASVAGVINNGSSLTIPAINLQPGGRGNLGLNFQVFPSAILGDTIHVSSHAVSGTDVSDAFAYSVVRGSFDPNDKQSTPNLSLQQVSAGAYIEYMIRFQNTGTDTAFNIVVTDTLTSLLDESSFQMISTSHLCTTIRNGKNISFEFLHILLPDKTTNEPKSHGWIRFRAKPIATIPLNSVIPNSVAIYFDYNAPVITNTATTTIALAPVPLQLLSFRALGNATNRKALLSWETTAERNTSYFEIQFSKDGITFEPCGNVRANGSGSGMYSFVKPMQQSLEFYRLKMVDIDGSYSFSPVVKVKLAGSNESITIVSNPVKNTLVIDVVDVSLAGKSAVLIDNKGAVVEQFILRNGLQQIPVGHIPAGLYYLKTMTGTWKIVLNP